MSVPAMERPVRTLIEFSALVGGAGLRTGICGVVIPFNSLLVVNDCTTPTVCNTLMHEILLSNLSQGGLARR